MLSDIWDSAPMPWNNLQWQKALNPARWRHTITSVDHHTSIRGMHVKVSNNTYPFAGIKVVAAVHREKF
jgi:hypothetical protein